MLNTMFREALSPVSPEEIRSRDRQFVWHSWSPLSEDRSRLTFSYGEKYKVWDIDGKEYIDCCSLNLTCGYRNTHIIQAAQEQLFKFLGTDISLASHEPVGLLAERLAKFLPEGLSKTLFVNSGSEGIEGALFIAASYAVHRGDPRTRVVSFSNGYHGSTLLNRSISKLPRVAHPFEHPLPVTHVDLPASPRELRTQDFLSPLLELFDEALREKTSPPMAVIVEPFLNVGGGVVLSEGFLRGLRELCNKAGALLILDEVFTGYARSGKMFAFEHEEIVPDILVSSKGLAGGYLPITAVTVQQRIYETFSKDLLLGGLRYGHTTSGHAVACAAALATLDLIEKEDLTVKSAAYGKILLDTFREYAGVGEVVDVRGFGLVLVLEMSSYEVGARFRLLAESNGLLVRQSGPAIMVVPPLIIDKEGINKISILLKKCLVEGKFLG